MAQTVIVPTDNTIEEHGKKKQMCETCSELELELVLCCKYYTT
jgi:hypothetical protein